MARIDELGERRSSLRDAARRTTQAGVRAAQNVRAGIQEVGRGVRQGFGNTAGATPPTSPTPPTGAVGPSGAPVAPGKEGGKSGLRRFLTPSAGLQTAGKVAGKVAKVAGKAAAFAAPATAIVSALRSYNTPTAEYAKRYGPATGEGIFEGLGNRASGVGEDLVNALNPLSDDTFGTRAGTPVTAATPGQVPQTSPGDRAGQTPPAGATPDFVRLTGADADAALNSAAPGTAAIRNERTGETRSYTPEGLRRLGGGGLTPEQAREESARRVASTEKQTAGLRDSRLMREAGFENDPEGYARHRARRERDNELGALTQGGMSLREANAAIFNRDAKLAKASASGGLDAGNLISLLGQQQDQAQHAESLGVRRNQFNLNQQQVNDQNAARERTATTKYIEQLNNEDPGVASAARGQLLQTFLQNPDSPEGRVLLSQATQALRQRSGDERGPIDAVASAIDGQPQFPGDLTQDEFSLEPGFGGQGVGGTIVKDKAGQVLGNLDDLPAEYAQAIKHVYARKNEKRGVR